jgi:hypothetical protein
MENGEWRMENGEWRMENGEWRMGNGELRVESWGYDWWQFHQVAERRM